MYILYVTMARANANRVFQQDVFQSRSNHMADFIAFLAFLQQHSKFPGCVKTFREVGHPLIFNSCLLLLVSSVCYNEKLAVHL